VELRLFSNRGYSKLFIYAPFSFCSIAVYRGCLLTFRSNYIAVMMNARTPHDDITKAGLIPPLQPNLTPANSSSVDRSHFLQHLVNHILVFVMLQMKVPPSVLIAVAAIAPVVAYGFEAEDFCLACCF